MADALKYLIDLFQARFSSLAHKAAREALPLAVKLVMDSMDGDARLTPATRLRIQGLMLDALRSAGFEGASDERDEG